jgi:hypothetical protein
MFTKHNILFVRYANPQNDTIYIEYGTDDDVNFYYMPVMPLDSYEWQILFKAGYDLDKIYLNTIEWIKNPNTYNRKSKNVTAIDNLQKIKFAKDADINVFWQKNYLVFSTHEQTKIYERKPNFDIAITEKNNPLMVYQSVHVDLPSSVWQQHKVKVDIPYFSNYSLYIASKNNLSFTLSHQK